MEQLEYEQIIRFRKEEYNRNGFNALEISRDELQKLTGSRKADIPVIEEAMRQCMLEGDRADETDGFMVTYYCDNLGSDRRKMY